MNYYEIPLIEINTNNLFTLGNDVRDYFNSIHYKSPGLTLLRAHFNETDKYIDLLLTCNSSINNPEDQLDAYYVMYGSNNFASRLAVTQFINYNINDDNWSNAGMLA